MGLNTPYACMQRGRLLPPVPVLEKTRMSEKRQDKRVIGLDVHPYLFTAAALAGGRMHSKRKWNGAWTGRTCVGWRAS